MTPNQKELAKLRKRRAELTEHMGDLRRQTVAADTLMRGLRKQYDEARKAERQVSSQLTKISKLIHEEDEEL